MKFDSYNYTFEELESRVASIIESQFPMIDRQCALKQILSFMDLTTLNGNDTDEKVMELCKQSKSYQNVLLGISNVAAVCVYPTFAKLVSTFLADSSVRTACVAGAFPSGQSPLDIRISEVKYAVQNGADDIDMVISRGKFLEGDFEYVSNEISSIKEACGDAHLKVILETGELGSVENIRKASELAILAGADFIKTSTGKIQPASTPESVLIMIDTIKEYYEKTGEMIGIKPAGGISETDDGLVYYMLVSEVLGDQWLDEKYFRVGASRLANKLIDEIYSLQ